MSLTDWIKNGWLKPHKTSAQEIADLLAIADRDIKASQLEGLETDWKLNIAYNACLQLATAALATTGYKATREMHHYRTIQSLVFTIGLDRDTVNLLDTFRKKRVISDYERAGTISDREAEEMIALAQDIKLEVKRWLRANHPHLIPE